MRPLPELTSANEWFWKSGSDDVLRIQGCDDCGQLVHPPVPICPYCRSRSWKPTAVSGRGTVVGFTVNAHRWLPGFDPPYVIANVALAEDARVHLTTNIVGCEPSDVRIGQVVSVRFEHQEDVWLPLFEPTGAVDPIDRVAEPVRPVPRPPVSEDRFEHRAVLSGIGRSRIGRRRVEARGHRRALDLSGHGGRRNERGRSVRHRGGPQDPPDLDQRWG